jgi:hypothetical protein
MIRDNCCGLCRSATGVCLTRLQCDHHKKARRLQDAEDNRQPGYRDPTARTAVNNVMRSQRTRTKGNQ